MERNIVIKKEFAPVMMHPDGLGYFLCWDYQPSYEDDGKGNQIEAEHGTCLSVFAPYRKPNLALAKFLINDFYNKETNRKIFEGFQYMGKTVYLSTENQANYTAAYVLASQTDGANLPYKIKTGSDEEGSSYVEFNTISQFSAFYMAMNAFINDCLQKGWDAKDSVDYTLIADALENVPELPADLDILTNTL